LLDLRALSLGVLVPGLIVGIGLAGVWRPWKPGPPPKKSFFALFSAIAFFVSYSLLLEVPPHPFGERTLAGLDWLLWIALLSAPLFLMEGAGKALALRSLSAAAMLAGLLRAMVVHHWSPGMAVLWLGGAALSLALLWIVGAGLNERVEGATMPLVLLVSATGLALAAGLNGSVLLGQTTGILCASLGAATILGFWHPCFRLRSGDVCFALSLFFFLALGAYFFSDLPALEGGLLAAGPAAARGVEVLFRLRAIPRRNLAVVLASAVPVVVAVVRSVLAFQEASSTDSYYDY
jgi:hypothetical protein